MKDILLDENGDLAVVNGDLSIGTSEEQHKRSILAANKGEYKEDVCVGVGLIDFINDDSPENMMLEVRKQFSRDGMKVNSVSFNNSKLQVDANY